MEVIKKTSIPKSDTWSRYFTPATEITYCWWFRNPAPVEGKVVYPIIYKGFIHLRWLEMGFLPSTVGLCLMLSLRCRLACRCSTCCCAATIGRSQFAPWFSRVPSRELTYPQKNGILKMIFLFPRWDMLIPWRVLFSELDFETGNDSTTQKTTRWIFFLARIDVLKILRWIKTSQNAWGIVTTNLKHQHFFDSITPWFKTWYIPWKSKTIQRVVSRMIHFKGFPAKFGRLGLPVLKRCTGVFFWMPSLKLT